MTYAFLARGRNEQQLLELDNALAANEEAKEENVDRANARAMEQLMGSMGGVMPTPPKPPVRRTET